MSPALSPPSSDDPSGAAAIASQQNDLDNLRSVPLYSFCSMSLRNYLGLCPALAVLLGMAAWGWGRLVEVQVDFGREVYLAWQLASGKRLYTDLIYYYGPLSPYFNAFLFKSLGVSIQSLLLGNLVIAAFIILILYRKRPRFPGWLRAGLAGVE
jgi:hypothetical protein